MIMQCGRVKMLLMDFFVYIRKAFHWCTDLRPGCCDSGRQVNSDRHCLERSPFLMRSLLNQMCEFILRRNPKSSGVKSRSLGMFVMSNHIAIAEPRASTSPPTAIHPWNNDGKATHAFSARLGQKLVGRIQICLQIGCAVCTCSALWQLVSQSEPSDSPASLRMQLCGAA